MALTAALLACCFASGGHAGYAPTRHMQTSGTAPPPMVRLTPALTLRGGACDADPILAAEAADVPANPKTWEEDHVLAFLEGLRPKFKDRTDQYRALFVDNDIDGTILLGLTVDKLEKAPAPSLPCVPVRALFRPGGRPPRVYRWLLGG